MAEAQTRIEELCFPAVQVPGSGADPTPQTLRREIDAWISSEAFCELVRAEGGDPIGTLAERLAYLDGFSAAAWDFRSRAARLAGAGFVERNQVAVDEVRGRRERLALAAARDSGWPRQERRSAASMTTCWCMAGSSGPTSGAVPMPRTSFAPGGYGHRRSQH